MKIALITPQSSKTGEQRYSELLINSLSKTNLDVEILDDLILNTHPFKALIGSIFLKSILRKKDVSIVHNLDNISPFLLNKPKKIKTISNIWDIAPIILPDIHNIRIKWDFKLLNRLIKNTDFIITASNSTKNDLINLLNVDPDKIKIIPLGIDLSMFYPREFKEEIFKKYFIDNDYILYCGTSNPRKNLINLIKAYLNVIYEIPHDLVIVGPINKDWIINLITNFLGNMETKEILSRIKIVGFVEYDELPFFYSAASLFIFPSLYEGFGLPPLEAMACGTPVIASKNSSIPEVVGKSGVYIKDPNDFQEISSKIKMVLGDERLQQKMRNKGLIQSKNFDWINTAKKTITFYEHVLKNDN